MIDEIESYRQDRGPLWCAIFDTLRDYRLSNMADAETGEPGFPLVDVMSNSGDGATIATGEMEMVALADEISLAYEAAKPAPASEAVAWRMRCADPKLAKQPAPWVLLSSDPQNIDTSYEVRPLYDHPAPADPRPEQVEAVAWDKRVEAVKCAWEVMQGQCSDGDGFTERAAHDLDNAINALVPAPATAPAPAAEMVAPPVTDEMLRAARDTLPGGFTDICDADLEDIWEAMHRAALSAPASAKVEAEGELRFVFDKFPCPDGARFIEVEDKDGFSLNAGEWRKRDDGLVELVVRLDQKEPG